MQCLFSLHPAAVFLLFAKRRNHGPGRGLKAGHCLFLPRRGSAQPFKPVLATIFLSFTKGRRSQAGCKFKGCMPPHPAYRKWHASFKPLHPALIFLLPAGCLQKGAPFTPPSPPTQFPIQCLVIFLPGSPRQLMVSGSCFLAGCE